MALTTSVLVPCPYMGDEGICECPIEVTLEYAPGEKETWDFPGTWGAWVVLDIYECQEGHVLSAQEIGTVEAWAIRTAEEQAQLGGAQ